MSIAYFGFQTIGAQASVTTNLIKKNDTLVFTCPGEGPQRIAALEVYIAVTSTPVPLRIGIYTTGNVLVAGGTSIISITNTSPNWIGYTGAGLTWYNGYTNLTGGIDYLLVWTISGGAEVKLYRTANGTKFGYIYTDYTAALPDPLPTPGWTAATNQDPIRCGVGWPDGGGHADDRFRGRRSQNMSYSGSIQRCTEAWAPRTGILNPSLDAQEDNNSRMN